MYAITELLDKIDINQDYFELHAIKLGKLMKRQKLKSKFTLEKSEIKYYTTKLNEIYKNWTNHGHPDWKVSEKNIAPRFTVVFERKG